MKSKNNIDLVKIIFFSSMIFGFFLFLGYGIFTDNALFKNLIFQNGASSFSDFWECVKDNIEGDPYSKHSCYPALANLIFSFFAGLIPDTSIVNYGETVNQIDQMIFFAYNTVGLTLFIMLINKIKDGKIIEKTVFLLLILLSAPYIYMFERGNIIIIAIITLMVFVWGKDSKNKWIRELSYISLAVSAAIKIYPALFGLLLIKERNYKAAIKCIVYGLMVFIIPFMLYDGFASIKTMVVNILSTNEIFKAELGYAYKINMASNISAILIICGVEVTNVNVNTVVSFLPYIYSIFAIISALSHKVKWKTNALLVSIIALVPGFSYVYTLVFFIIPIIGMLDSKEKRTIVDNICAICFALIFIPIPYDAPALLLPLQTAYHYTFSTYVEGIAVMIIAFALTVEGMIYGLKKIRNSQMLSN